MRLKARRQFVTVCMASIDRAATYLHQAMAYLETHDLCHSDKTIPRLRHSVNTGSDATKPTIQSATVLKDTAHAQMGETIDDLNSVAVSPLQ